MSIVVGVSDTPLGRRTLERAREEAELRGAPLLLVSQVTTPRSAEGARGYTREQQARLDWLESRAVDLRASGIEVGTRLPRAPSNLGEAVLEVAAEVDAELIVIGIPRRSAVGKALLGSASQQVLLRSECAVLGVKLPPEEDDFR